MRPRLRLVRHALYALIALASCGKDEEQPPPPPQQTSCGSACTTQAQCGAVGKSICDCGNCTAAGALGGDGGTEMLTGLAKARLSWSSALKASRPPTVKVWVFHFHNPDGSTLTCDKVLEGTFPDKAKMNPVKDDPTRVRIDATWNLNPDTIDVPTGTLPAGVKLLFYVEAYSTLDGSGANVGRGCGADFVVDTATILNFPLTVQ